MDVVAVQSAGILTDACSAHQRVALQTGGALHSLRTIGVGFADDVLQGQVLGPHLVYVAVGAAPRTGVADHGVDAAVVTSLGEGSRRSGAGGQAGGVADGVGEEEGVVGAGEEGAAGAVVPPDLAADALPVAGPALGDPDGVGVVGIIEEPILSQRAVLLAHVQRGASIAVHPPVVEIVALRTLEVGGPRALYAPSVTQLAEVGLVPVLVLAVRRGGRIVRVRGVGRRGVPVGSVVQLVCCEGSEVVVLRVGRTPGPCAWHLEVEVGRAVRGPAVLISGVAAIGDRGVVGGSGAVGADAGGPVVDQVVVVLAHVAGGGCSRTVVTASIAARAHPSSGCIRGEELSDDASRGVDPCVAVAVAVVGILLPFVVPGCTGLAVVIEALGAGEAVLVAEVADVGLPDERVCVVGRPGVAR